MCLDGHAAVHHNYMDSYKFHFFCFGLWLDCNMCFDLLRFLKSWICCYYFSCCCCCCSNVFSQSIIFFSALHYIVATYNLKVRQSKGSKRFKIIITKIIIIKKTYEHKKSFTRAATHKACRSNYNLFFVLPRTSKCIIGTSTLPYYIYFALELNMHRIDKTSYTYTQTHCNAIMVVA